MKSSLDGSGNQTGNLFHMLYEHYGPQHWWPAESAFEVAVGAILTQNTAWGNVERAIGGLKTGHLLSPQGILECPTLVLQETVRAAGFFRQKAKRLKVFCAFIMEELGGDLFSLRERPLQEARGALLSLSGIGRETADSILLYALGFPIFVVDAYTARILSRVTGRDPESLSYEELQEYFMDRLPHDVALFNEYHALLVRHAKELCRKKPLCEKCPVEQCQARKEN